MSHLISITDEDALELESAFKDQLEESNAELRSANNLHHRQRLQRRIASLERLLHAIGQRRLYDSSMRR